MDLIQYKNRNISCDHFNDTITKLHETSRVELNKRYNNDTYILCDNHDRPVYLKMNYSNYKFDDYDANLLYLSIYFQVQAIEQLPKYIMYLSKMYKCDNPQYLVLLFIDSEFEEYIDYLPNTLRYLAVDTYHRMYNDFMCEELLYISMIAVHKLKHPHWTPQKKLNDELRNNSKFVKFDDYSYYRI